MKAVGYRESLPVTDPDCLLDTTLSVPDPGPRDLLVEVKAISVNPVDTKIRRRSAPAAGEWAILGFDASGVVRAVGPDVTGFRAGDEVWYAGTPARHGTNAEMHLVDERLVSHRPVTVSHAEAAALPLTGLTAWELLFDRLGILPGKHHEGQSLLIVGAGGGVGSILTQIARRLTGMTIIGTAGRPETFAWVESLGAHQVIDHRIPLADGLRALGLASVTHVAALTRTDLHFPALAEMLAPQGRLALIDDPGPVDIGLLKQKSVSIHWEFMFTRALFATADMARQQAALAELASLVDEGLVRTTLTEHFGRVCAANLIRAHARLENGISRGKIVLEGF